MTTAGAQRFRLASGGRLNRDMPLGFTFDGRRYDGFAGDTLASALLANGVRLVGRSFKYHRPRGIFTAGSEEPNAIVEIGTGARREPNTRATTTELYDGLVAASQNRWPSLAFDLMSVNNLLAPMFVAGFYYKTFMWPAAFWEKVYEPMIRRAAGLGRAAEFADPDRYEKVTAHCDVLVVGGGPAGLMAALSAARSGARVMIADESFELGGRLLSEQRVVGGEAASQWIADVAAELASMPAVRVLPRTTVFGAYDGGTYAAVERVADHLAEAPAHLPRQRLWRIVAKRAVLATGATERGIVFGNNDRPGVMLAGAVRTYFNRFAVAPGRRVVVFTATDDGAILVRDLAAAGVGIAALIDARKASTKATRDVAAAHGVRLVNGVVNAVAGRLGVTGARIQPHDGAAFNVSCDLVAVSGGFNPNIQLATHRGDRATWNDDLSAFVMSSPPRDMAIAGSAAGAFALSRCLATGAAAGSAAAEATGFTAVPRDVPEVAGDAVGVSAFWHVGHARAKSFVDLQNDVAATDLALAVQEGYGAIEHVKRYTTLGMATDQGRTSSVNGSAIVAHLTGRSIAATGSTSARPPYTPVSLAAFAGHHRGPSFKPRRLLASHAWATEQGAVFTEAGLWMRPSYFPRPGERDWLETTTREAAAVRNAVGVCDVSSLGKIDVQGPDALEFIERIYANGMRSLKVGRVRYGVMLREDGIVLDDGTVARLGDQQFLITTTTANAVKVYQHLQLCLQWHWPTLDVQIVSATEQWAQYAIAGPRSRDVLRGIVDGSCDVSDAAVPYLHAGPVLVAGRTAGRLFRVSYSGELAYEIAVPARFGDAMMRAIMAAGADFGIVPYGTEALGVLRIEKGHVSGPELNGTTTMGDLGLDGMRSRKKDYIGRVLAEREGLVAPDRPSLVGLRPIDRSRRLRAGAHFIARGRAMRAENDEGHMTSVAYSPSLGHWIGLGLLARGPERLGEIVIAADPLHDRSIEVEVVSPIFIDSEGERLRG